MRAGEFELIHRHFAPLATAPGALALLDDAALIEAETGEEIVVTVDAMVQGVHFLHDDPPDLVARKLLRVNLSDLAGMGARPFGYLLTTAWSGAVDEAWVAEFARGLAIDQAEFGLSLLGGDTVSTPGPVSFTATLLGRVAAGRALRRDGARPGERLYLTGSLGDGALGLKAARGELDGLLVPEDREALAGRYRLPEPRIALGLGLVGLASAAMDVSDGLIQDAGHMARASGVRLVVERGRLPLSAPAARAVAADPALWDGVMGGGDDYELLVSAPAGEAVDAAFTEIGRVEAGEGVVALDEAGRPLEIRRAGWRHFRDGEREPA